LANDDRAAAVFGAAYHRFGVNPIVRRDELDAIENRLGCKLPAEYRSFLLDIGNGGAGPGYGLWPVGRWDPTNRRLESIEPPSWPDAPGKPFPHSQPWNVRATAIGPPPSAKADPAEHDRYHQKLDVITWAAGNADSALPIIDLGCAIRLLLVVAGAERGHVWIDDRASDAGIYPAAVPGRDRMTFAEVYNDWLDQSVAFCQTGERVRPLW
jgi:hypothetical protein